MSDCVPYIIDTPEWFMSHNNFRWNHLVNLVEKVGKTLDTCDEHDMLRNIGLVLHVCRHGILYDLAVYYKYEILSAKELLTYATVGDIYVKQSLDATVSETDRMEALRIFCELFRMLSEYAELIADTTCPDEHGKPLMNMKLVESIVFKGIWLRIKRFFHRKKVTQEQVFRSVRNYLVAQLDSCVKQTGIDTGELRFSQPKSFKVITDEKLTEIPDMKLAFLIPNTVVPFANDAIRTWSRQYDKAVSIGAPSILLYNALYHECKSIAIASMCVFAKYLSEDEALDQLRQFSKHWNDAQVPLEEHTEGTDVVEQSLASYKSLYIWLTETWEAEARKLDTDNILSRVTADLKVSTGEGDEVE